MSGFSKAFLEKYAIRSLLGQGGVGRVYLAQDCRLRRPVAIKILLSAGIEGDVGVQRFQEEARVTASIRHPGIVALYDWGVECGHPYLVFEYVDGQTIAQRISQSGAFSSIETGAIALDVLSALEAAHACRIVHRDLKPGNIMIRKDDARTMVMDFGMAKAQDRHSFSTRQGIILGTMQYMAPEQIRGEDVSPATDIYAMGCVLYEMLAGVPAFDAPDPSTVLEQHLTGPTPSIQGTRSDVIPGLARVIATALARNPADRFPEAGAMREAIAQLALEDATLVDVHVPPKALPTIRIAVPTLLEPKAHLRAGAHPPPRNVGSPTQILPIPASRQTGEAPAAHARTSPDPVPPGRRTLPDIPDLPAQARVSSDRRVARPRRSLAQRRAQVALLAGAIVVAGALGAHLTGLLHAPIPFHADLRLAAGGLGIEWTSANEGIGVVEARRLRADGTPDPAAQIVWRREAKAAIRHSVVLNDVPLDHPMDLRVGVQGGPTEPIGSVVAPADWLLDVTYPDLSTVQVTVSAPGGTVAWTTPAGASGIRRVPVWGGRATGTFHVAPLAQLDRPELHVERGPSRTDVYVLPPLKGALRTLLDLDAQAEVGRIASRLVHSLPYLQLRDLSILKRGKGHWSTSGKADALMPPDRGSRVWTDLVTRAVADARWYPALRTVAGVSPSILADTSIPVERRLTLYEVLHALLPIDLFCLDRGIEPILGICALLAPTVRYAQALDKELPRPPQGSGEVSLLDQPATLATGDAMISTAYAGLAKLLVGVDTRRTEVTTDPAHLRNAEDSRSLRATLSLANARADRARVLEAAFREPRSDFFFEVRFEPVRGGRRLSVTLWDPRRGSHYSNGMDWMMGTSIMHERVTIAPEALPAGEYAVVVSYRHMPGVTIDQIHGVDIGIGILTKLSILW